MPSQAGFSQFVRPFSTAALAHAALVGALACFAGGCAREVTRQKVAQRIRSCSLPSDQRTSLTSYWTQPRVRIRYPSYWTAGELAAIRGAVDEWNALSTEVWGAAIFAMDPPGTTTDPAPPFVGTSGSAVGGAFCSTLSQVPRPPVINLYKLGEVSSPPPPGFPHRYYEYRGAPGASLNVQWTLSGSGFGPTFDRATAVTERCYERAPGASSDTMDALPVGVSVRRNALEHRITFNYEQFNHPERVSPPDNYDLRSIALHELGHVVGLGHSCSGANEGDLPNCGALRQSDHPYRLAAMNAFYSIFNGIGEIKHLLNENDQGRSNCLYLR